MDRKKYYKMLLLAIVAVLLSACDRAEESAKPLSISAVTNETLLNSSAKTDGWYMYGGSY